MKKIFRIIMLILTKAKIERDERSQRFEVLECYLSLANCQSHLNQFDELEAKTMRAKDKLDMRFYTLMELRGIKEHEINNTIIFRQLNLCSN